MIDPFFALRATTDDTQKEVSEVPGGDGTGPAGMGPMTGRAAGYCAGYPAPGYLNGVPGGWGGPAAWGAVPPYGSAAHGYSAYSAPRGYGYGMGSRFGWGFRPGRVFARGYGRAWQGYGGPVGRGRGRGFGRARFVGAYSGW